MRLHDHRIREEILLPDHHARLEALLATVKSAAAAGDARTLQHAWTELEDGVSIHLRAEEEDLLPAFAVEHPDEAAAIRAEHVEIRRLLAELGVSVDLKRLSIGVLDELVERMRAHARREDALLYPWAMRNLSARWPHFLDALLGRLPH